jgi:hypothetical protein
MSNTWVIENQTAGDDLQIERDIGDIDPLDPLIKAWLTVKAKMSDTDAQAALQKVITTAAVPGVGQITEDGSELQGNGTGTTIFQLTAAETAALGTIIRYFYDIQGKSATGKVYTSQHPDTGRAVSRMKFRQGVTDATS